MRRSSPVRPVHALLLTALLTPSAAPAAAQGTFTLPVRAPTVVPRPLPVPVPGLGLRPLLVPGTQPLKKSSVTKDSYAAAGSAGPLVCSRETFNVATAPIEYATYNLDGDKMWVGSLVDASTLQNGLGSLRAVNVPESRRAPYRVTTALPIANGSATIQPNLSAYNGALAGIRQALSGTPYGSSTRYEVTEQSTAETSALNLGLNARYLTGKVSMNLSSASSSLNNTVTAAFVQNAFTVNADLGGRPARDAFLLNPTPEDLTAVSGAAYIDSLTYGRLLMVTMTSNYSSQEMKLALQAAYEGVAYGASGSLNVDVKKVIQGSSFKVYASGGDEQAVVDLIRTQKLGSYFQRPATPTTLVPISYTARDVDSGLYAAFSTTGRYAATVCNPASVKVSMRMYYQSIEPEDSKYDDIYGSLSWDGQALWNVGSGSHFDLYKGQTFTVTAQPLPLTLNYDEPRSARISGSVMDYDSTSANDVVGNFNDLIDLNAVAAEFRADPGRTTVRREIRRRGESDADGVLIIEFSRLN